MSIYVNYTERVTYSLLSIIIGELSVLVSFFFFC